MNFKNAFNEVSLTLKASKAWEAMVLTVENSPWHREANVAVHTEMVVAEYMARSPEVWTKEDFAGACAVLFHDVGKPACRVEKHSEARGTYYAYHGHEKVSARQFVNFVMSHANVRNVFDSIDSSGNVLFAAAWMIEYHLPWDIKDSRKRDNLFRTVHKFVGGPDVFMNVVLSDAYGRISDDATEKRAKCDEWATKFREDYSGKVDYFDFLDKQFSTNAEGKIPAFILIGASGSGKSTFRNKIMKQDMGTKVFSLDDLRIEMYGGDYDRAYLRSIDDPHFKPAGRGRFMDIIRTNKVNAVIVDNVNTTKKSRVMYADEMQRRGYLVTAVVFVTSLKTVIDRQKTREDKQVPTDAVVRQYNGVDLPSLGEFDKIEIFFGE